jgi:Flp pilus assembly pilin Flp
MKVHLPHSTTIRHLLRRLRSSERGQDLIEYALLGAFIAIIGVSLLMSIGADVGTSYKSVQNSVAAGASQSGGGAGSPGGAAGGNSGGTGSPAGSGGSGSSGSSGGNTGTTPPGGSGGSGGSGSGGGTGGTGNPPRTIPPPTPR